MTKHKLKSVEENGSTQEYARAALVLIARTRFCAFVDKFGRDPERDEPLFFDESKDFPVKADLSTAIRQIREGANAAGVKAAPVIAFLGLNHACSEEARPRVTSIGRQARHSSDGSQRQAVRESSAWTKFFADKRLHSRHGITSEELQLLGGASFMGEVTKVEDILFVLSVIRSRENRS